MAPVCTVCYLLPRQVPQCRRRISSAYCNHYWDVETIEMWSLTLRVNQMNGIHQVRHVYRNFVRNPVGWRLCDCGISLWACYSYACCACSTNSHHRPLLPISTAPSASDYSEQTFTFIARKSPYLVAWQARCYVTHDATNLLWLWHWKIWEHALYSPDMGPCDINMFPKWKEPLQNIRFPDLASVFRAVGLSYATINN